MSDILFQCKAGINKRPGVLTCTRDRLVFVDDSGTAVTITINIRDVSKQGEKTAMMRIEYLQDDGDGSNSSRNITVFFGSAFDKMLSLKEILLQLVNPTQSYPASAPPSSSTAPVPTIDSSKQIPSKASSNIAIPSMPPPRRVTSVLNMASSSSRTNIDVKSQLLRSNRDLQTQYESLVEKHIISADEFWSNRQAAGIQDAGASPGMPSSLLAEVRAQVGEQNRRTVELDGHIVAQIFRMYPNIERAYHALVPDRMTQNEFWTKYFEAKTMYLEGNYKSAGPVSLQELLTPTEGADGFLSKQQTVKTKETLPVDRFVNIMELDDKELKSITSRDAQTAVRDPVYNVDDVSPPWSRDSVAASVDSSAKDTFSYRLNKHAMMVLDTEVPRPSRDEYHALMMKHITIDDLAPLPPLPVAPLTLNALIRTSHSSVDVDPDAIDRFMRSVRDCPLDLSVACPDSVTAAQFIKAHTKTSSETKTKELNLNQSTLISPLKMELEALILAMQEVTRHAWHELRLTMSPEGALDVGDADKLSRLSTKIWTITQQFGEFSAKLTPEQSNFVTNATQHHVNGLKRVQGLIDRVKAGAAS